MSQAINAYYRITASPEFRELERMREKAGHDEAQALHHAEQKGRAEGRAESMLKMAQAMLSDGEPLNKILRYTGLTAEELNAINR